MAGIDSAPVLHEGASGEWVLYLQQLLETAGHSPGAITHHFDGATKAAVHKYQASVRDFKGADYLTEDGFVGPQTWHSLYSSATLMHNISEGDAKLTHDATYAQGDADELAMATEVGRSGWQRGDLTLNVRDFRGELFTGEAFIRFSDDQGAAVDDGGYVQGGELHLPGRWMPSPGNVHVNLAVYQGQIDHAANNLELKPWKGRLHLEVTQEFTPGKMTHRQAAERGWSEEAKIHGGIDIEVVSFGVEATVGHSGSSSEGMDEEVEVREAKPTLSLLQQ